VETSEETEVGGGTDEAAVGLTVGESHGYTIEAAHLKHSFYMTNKECGLLGLEWKQTTLRGSADYDWFSWDAEAACGGKKAKGYRYGDSYMIKLCCSSAAVEMSEETEVGEPYWARSVSKACACSGYTNDLGRGGADCSAAGHGEPWCYISDSAGCSDSTGASGRKWSVKACGAGLEEAVGTKICKQDGKDSGVCDERKYLPASDACDNCKRGRRWVGWGGFGNHWCCTEADARNNDDCSCWHVRYHAEVDAAVETSEETEVGDASMQFAVQNEAVKTSDVAVYGLAFIGFGVVVFGAYKHYTGGKTHGDHVQIL
jgi:hypothetical protein